MKDLLCGPRQRTSGRRQRPDDSFYSDAASETSSVCSETSFRTGSEISDVCEICLFRYFTVHLLWVFLQIFSAVYLILPR